MGYFQLGHIHITGLKSNQTDSRAATLAGQVDNDGSCSGSTYCDPYGTWTDVIVLATLTFTLLDYQATVRLNTNQVILRSGVTCEFAATHCVDVEGGNTYWNALPAQDSCGISNYGAFYTGFAEILTDNTGVQPHIVYTLNSQDTVFALMKKGVETMYGHVLIRTEHPKLLIFETVSDNKVFSKVHKPENLDIFTYMNSKFVYVEKHIRTQISQLYRNVLQQQCNSNRKY